MQLTKLFHVQALTKTFTLIVQQHNTNQVKLPQVCPEL